jgi:hypothetical protein
VDTEARSEIRQATSVAPADAANAIYRKRVGRDHGAHRAKSSVHHLDHARSGGIEELGNQNDYRHFLLSVCFTSAGKRIRQIHSVLISKRTQAHAASRILTLGQRDKHRA